ncbi:hypothetical protein JZ751_006516 [Albula glossodonta]|uniref:Uncharacterized protein n=1 Tax=Albula glossodonta TaxID=121402 RepID=A0A8T2NE66_9TELE|nr:hypothetical protein JZ751_006516 [Albula glossodonta]
MTPPAILMFSAESKKLLGVWTGPQLQGERGSITLSGFSDCLTSDLVYRDADCQRSENGQNQNPSPGSDGPAQCKQRKLALQGKGAVKAVPGAGKTWPTGASERDMALHEHLVLTVQCTEEGLCTSGTDNVQITDASLARATVLFTKGNGVKKGGPELQGKIFRQKKTNLTVSDCRCLFVLLPLAVCGLSQSRPYDARRGWI